MSYIEKYPNLVGKKVVLTEMKESMSGLFEKGTEVTITDKDHKRGYTFEDDKGNKIIEAGFDGFQLLKDVE